MAQQNSRAQQQRRQLIIILVVILIMAFGLFYFVLGGDKQKEKKEFQRPEGQVSVPYLKRNIKLAERISNQDFTVRFYKPESVPVDAVIDVKKFVGRFATKPLLAGDYIKESDVSQAGAVAGYSGLVSPGKRLVVLDGNIFPGALSTIRIGDHIDLLAIGEPNGASSTAGGVGGGRTAEDSANSLQGGGAQPGDPNSKARQRARARAGAGGGRVGSASATLVAENALVLKTPDRDKTRNFIVLEMEPQDAHVTTLMASAGATMRFVFRPFNDVVRHTEPEPVKVTTRLPKPAADPDAVMFIMGNVRSNSIPVSERYSSPKDQYIDYGVAEGSSQSALYRDGQGRVPANSDNKPLSNASPDTKEEQ
jgi:Flp pilus assembly protein CpaB